MSARYRSEMILMVRCFVALAKALEDANQTRRLLCLALIYEGGRRGEAAALGGVGLQIHS